MHVAIITAGGAGMFCGSCMHDNTWAKSLMERGAEVSLIPTYTPIRVDEENQSRRDVHLGGINIYLEEKLPLWRTLPRWMVRWLDAPGVIGLASKIGVSNDADDLGGLTVSLLDGELGPHRREVHELVDFLCDRLRPDVIVFSNALLVGVLRTLRSRFAGPILCLLQGDDVFLEDLPEPHRTQALDRIRERSREFDGLLVHSRYYSEFMQGYLRLPAERFHRLPLGIDLSRHDGLPTERPHDPFAIGFFARICPEKGFDRAIDAFRLLHAKHPRTRLRAGGYLGPRDAKFFARATQAAADLGDAFEYVGSPATHAEKVSFLKSLDVLSVPTAYREPKGLPILEALANGVPVVQPRHGAFPELLEATGGGLLVEPGDPQALADAWERLLLDPAERLEFARRGHAGVRSAFGPARMAEESLALFARLQAAR